MSELLQHIKIPFAGFLTTATGYVISLELATQIAQLIAATLAIATGLCTLIIALKKLGDKDAIK